MVFGIYKFVSYFDHIIVEINVTIDDIEKTRLESTDQGWVLNVAFVNHFLIDAIKNLELSGFVLVLFELS
jgi:hypothetical protein